MPKFIGNDARPETKHIHTDAMQTGERVRLTYAQQKLLPAAAVTCSLDTSDRGSKGSYAKRWYRWFASPDAINSCTRATQSMLARGRIQGPVAAR